MAAKKSGGWRQHKTGKAKKKTGKRKYHSNLGGPHKKAKKKGKKKAKRKAHKKHDSVAAHMAAANRRGAGFGAKVTLHGIQTNVKRRRGKRWLCGGPVRSGCGGSDSRVIGKVR